MLIKKYKKYFIEQLSTIYEEGEIESFFYLILENKNNLKRIDLALNIEIELTNSEHWNEILEQLKNQVPIQYILGTTNFYGLDFEVNDKVLIPRPETEELVEWIISEDSKIERFNNLKILDIGTGSGCIAIALAKNIPNSEVYAIDISKKALEIATKNKVTNDVKVTFLEKDILQTGDLKNKFEVIVSNPPYVRNLEKVEIHKNVLDYEPHLALFVDDNNALVFYKKIAELAQKHLTENGTLFFEINQYLGKEMVSLLEELNFKNIELRKDIYGNDRMIKAKRN
jgi:release factor glutamine methyltransferase